MTGRFSPPSDFAAAANVSSDAPYREAAADRLGFWAARAAELDWFEPWRNVLDWDPPQARWFTGGKLNAAWNCLDRHLPDLASKRAIIWEGEPGDRRDYTYAQLHAAVCRLANALRGLGVGKGDRVAIYLPMIPEAVIGMLACARIGAVHSVVFAGFSARSLHDRIDDARAACVITADAGFRRGKVLPLKASVDEAIDGLDCVRSVVVVSRARCSESQTDQGQGGSGDSAVAGALSDLGAGMTPGRDHWYHDLVAGAADTCPAEPMDSEDLLFVLYTSGTTGKPKGVMHSTGGYLTQVAVTAKWVLDLKPDDVYWCSADVGWVTGHSYITYGPLANGATVLVYEGAPDTPARGRFWELCESHGVTIFYTAPTAIRSFMKWGEEWIKGHDLSRLRLIGTVGEPINPEAWLWYRETIGGGRCPVIDTWWQTETGGMMITPLPGVTATAPGSATRAFPGIDATILADDGTPAASGYLAITSPWPGMLRGVWGDEQRYRDTYWSKWPGVYFPADAARIDKNGDYWITGRVDDVLNVAGHRLGTAEIESALVSHPAVAEAAVVGRADKIKGQAVAAFVSLMEGSAKQDLHDLRAEIMQHTAEEIGAIARPSELHFAAELPKTRSGKIMRRLLRDIAEGRAMGDTTTLADPSVVEALKQHYADKEE